MKFAQHVPGALGILVANVGGFDRNSGEPEKTYSYIVLLAAHATQSDTTSVQKTNEDTREKACLPQLEVNE